MILQRFDLSPAAAASGLAYRAESASVSAEPTGAVVVGERGSLHLDSYFGAFFADYWLAFTSVGAVTLELDLDGAGVVEIVDAARRTIARTAFASDLSGPCRVRVPVDLDASQGRLGCVLTTETGCRLSAGCWTTELAARRQPSVGAVLCTYNRPDQLRANLQTLANSAAGQQLQQIFIINQGEAFTLGDMGARDDAFWSRVELVEQPNFGGCGGFTRGMIEVAERAELSHFIVLDDDIVIHPESIGRAIAFAAYADADIAVGGQMLDALQPHMLYESGGMVEPTTGRWNSVERDLDLAASGALDRFTQARTVDYNGWWFLLASVETCREVGFPMPCFIRGDDVEFGWRATRAGRRTVTMPGVAVWHEPFYAKPPGWQHYFEVRNRLTMISVHETGDLGAIRRELRRTFTHDAMLSRYHLCQLMIEGIADYLAGPQRCFDSTADRLADLTAIVTELGPTRVTGEAIATDPGFSRRRRRLTLAAMPLVRVARLVAPGGKTSGDKPRVISDLTPWRPAVFGRYAVASATDSDGLLEYRRRPAVERGQLIEFERTLRRLRHFSVGSGDVDDSAGVAWLGRWRQLLGLHPAGEARSARPGE